MLLAPTIVTKEVATRLDEQELSRVLYKNAVYVVETLLDKSWSEYSHDGWLQLNKNYLRKVYGSKYLTLFQALEAADILEICHEYTFYQKGQDPCTAYPKSYRIKRTAFDDGYAIRDSRAEEEERDIMSEDQRALVMDALARLELDYEAALKYVYDHAANLTLAKDYYVNDEIFEEVVQMKDGTNTFFGSVTKVAAEAAKAGKVVVQNMKLPNKAVVAHPEQFIHEAQAQTKFQWARAVTKVEAGIFRVRRNATNHRLDTNLTNLPNQLCQFLTVDGEQLGGWDASNSQFAILAAVVQHPELFKPEKAKFFQHYQLDDQTLQFFAYAESGTLYRSLASEWGMEAADAKTAAFCVAFSGASAMSKAKRILKDKYPQLVKMTDDFKKEHGDNALAILLQQCEAEVFIDDAYLPMLRAGVWSLTKHDSLIVKDSQKDTAFDVLQLSLGKHKVVCALKWETMEPKVRTKRQK